MSSIETTQQATTIDAAEEAPAAGARVPVSLQRGIDVLRETLRTLPRSPGVYRMVSAGADVLYVGKARNLRARVTSYTHPARLAERTRRMIAETATLEVVRTHTEVEALLLEINLIKRHRPRFNVLLRDDKSFPHILLTGDHPYPRVAKHRGARTRQGDYFGPFASAGSVNRTLTALQRAFLLRNCTDAMFASRSRPCLQYQIKRCTAPCVGYATEAEYGAQVAQARAFLTGRSRQVQDALVQEMQEAAERLDFETAARLRDRVRAMTQIQAHQDINVAGLTDADVVAAHAEGGAVCIQVFFFRGGQNYGNRAYFPSHDKSLGEAEVLAAFLGQFYESRPAPPLVLLSHAPAEADLIAEALSVRAERRVRLAVPRRGDKRKVVEHALVNAREALGRRLAESSSQQRLLAGVAEIFGLDAPPGRIEVYDNSHIQGRDAVGAMIVAGPEGLMKQHYRKFNIRAEATAGDSRSDDYAMMREVLHRRFSRVLKEDPERAEGQWPDLVLIDGGLGQLGAATGVLEELGIADLPIAAIAKGPDRDAGRERFFLPGQAPFQLEPRNPVLYYLQRLRDEAHRFAIDTHRLRRQRAIGRSELDEIAGIGPRRKKALLHHFGSARAVARAGLADLEAVPGINKSVAKWIYSHFHEAG